MSVNKTGRVPTGETEETRQGAGRPRTEGAAPGGGPPGDMARRMNLFAPLTDDPSYKWKVLASVIFGLFMVILDTTVVNVALKTLQAEVHRLDQRGAVGDQPLHPGAGHRHAALGVPGREIRHQEDLCRRRWSLFVLGSALCGVAINASDSLLLLIVARAIQGIGGGLALPLGTAMLFGAFPPKERGVALGIFGIALVFAPASGPLLGGWLVDHNLLSWIFFLNMPIGMLGIGLASSFLRDRKSERPLKADMLGIIFSTLGFGAVLYGASRRASRAGAAGPTPHTLTAFAVGVVALIVFVHRRTAHRRAAARPAPLQAPQLHHRQHRRLGGHRRPLRRRVPPAALPADPARQERLRHRPLPAAAGAHLRLGHAHRRAPGRPLRPAPAAGRRLRPDRLQHLAVPRHHSIDTDLGWITFLLIMRGIGFGLVIQNTLVAALRDVPGRLTARATSLTNATRQTVQSIGVAILATILTSADHHQHRRRDPQELAQPGHPAPAGAGRDAGQLCSSSRTPPAAASPPTWRRPRPRSARSSKPPSTSSRTSRSPASTTPTPRPSSSPCWRPCSPSSCPAGPPPTPPHPRKRQTSLAPTRAAAPRSLRTNEAARPARPGLESRGVSRLFKPADASCPNSQTMLVVGALAPPHSPCS